MKCCKIPKIELCKYFATVSELKIPKKKPLVTFRGDSKSISLLGCSLYGTSLYLHSVHIKQMLILIIISGYNRQVRVSGYGRNMNYRTEVTIVSNLRMLHILCATTRRTDRSNVRINYMPSESIAQTTYVQLILPTFCAHLLNFESHVNSNVIRGLIVYLNLNNTTFAVFSLLHGYFRTVKFSSLPRH